MSLPFFQRKNLKSRPARAAMKRPAFRLDPIVQLEDRAVPAAFIWDGTGDGTSWSDPANWNLDSGFPNAASDTASFNAGSASVTVTGTVSPDSVSFAAGSNFNISGGTLSLTTGIVHSGGSNTIGSIIDGAGSVTVSNGTLILGNANTYAGQTDINGGVLSLVSGGSLGGGTRNINNGGTLEINDFTHNQSLNLNAGGTLRGIGVNARENGTVTLANGTVTIGTVSGTDVFTLGDGANDLTGGGAANVVSVAGSGKVVLTQSAAFTSSKWSIDSGATLSVSNNNQLGAVANPITINGGTLNITGTGISFATANHPLTVSASGGNLTLAAGSGTTTITNAPTYNGALTVNVNATLASSVASGLNGATVNLNSGGVLSATSAVDSPNSFAGATINLNGGNITVSGPNSATTQVWGGNLFVVGSGSAIQFTNAQGGGGFVNTSFNSLTYATAGNLTLNVQNTGSVTSTGTLSFASGITATEDGTINMITTTSPAQRVTYVNSGTLTIANSKTLTASASETFNGTAYNTWLTRFNINAAQNYAGTLRASGSEIRVSSAVSLGTSKFQASTNGIFSSYIPAGSAANSLGSAIFELNGGVVFVNPGNDGSAISYGGNFKVLAGGGTINLGNDGGVLQTGSGTFGSLEFTTAGNPTLALRTTNPAGTINYTGRSILFNTLTMTENGTLNAATGGAGVVIAGTTAWTNARTLTINGTSNPVVVRGTLSGSASNALSFAGANTGVQIGDATAPLIGVGNLGIASGFTLRNGSASNVINGSLTLADAASTSLNLNGNNLTIGTLLGGGAAGGTITTTGSPTLTIGIDGGSGTFDGVIATTGIKLVKGGAGTQTITRGQSFTGGLSIYGGTVKLDFSAERTDTNILNAANSLTLGGGTLVIQGDDNGSANSQTLGNVTIASGSSSIQVLESGGISASLDVGTMLQDGSNLAGSVDFVLPTVGTFSMNQAFNTATTVRPWATVNSGADYASNTAAGTTTVPLNAADTAETGWTSTTANYSFSTVGTTTLTGARSARTLRFTGASAQTIDLDAFNLDVQGILNAGLGTLTIQAAGIGKINLATGDAYFNTGANAMAISTPIINSSTNRFVKVGTGTATVSGDSSASTFATFVNAGTLKLSGGNNRLPTATNLNINSGPSGAAAFDLNGVSQQVNALGSLSTANQLTSPQIVNNNATAGALTVSGTPSTTFSGLLGAAGMANFSLTKSGSSVLTLQTPYTTLVAPRVNGSNIYTGDTNVTGGAIVFATSGAFSTGSNYKLNGGMIGPAVDMDLANATSDFSPTLGTGAGQVQFSGLGGGFAAGGAARTVNVGGAGAPLVWNSTPNFLTTGQALYLGSDGAYAVTLANPIDLNGANRTVQVDSNQGLLSGTLSGGAGALTKTGTGTLLLSGNGATFVGGITVSQGTLNSTGTATGNNRISVGSSGTFSRGSAATSTREIEGVSGSVLTNTASTADWFINALADAQYAGSLSFNANSNFAKYGSGEQQFVGSGTWASRNPASIGTGTVRVGGTVAVSLGGTGGTAVQLDISPLAALVLDNTTSFAAGRLTTGQNVQLLGGTLRYLGNPSQNSVHTTLTSTLTFLNQGASTFDVYPGSTSFNAGMQFGALARLSGTINFTNDGGTGTARGTLGGGGAADPFIKFTTAPTLTNGIIVGGFVNGANFATYDATQGVQALGTYGSLGGGSTVNALVSGGGTTAGETLNSLKLSGGGTLDITGGGSLTAATGMILKTGAGAVTISNGGGGSPTLVGSAVGELAFYVGQGTLTVSTKLNTGAAADNYVKSGPGLLDLTNATRNGTDTSNIFAAEGVVRIGQANAANFVLTPTGGVFEIIGNGATYSPALGTATGNVNWGTSGGTKPRTNGGGGFAAFGQDVTLSFTTASLTWNTTPNFVQNGQPMVLGSPTANKKITLTNNINLGSTTNELNLREINVQQGVQTDGSADAELSGQITGGIQSHLVKLGAGKLILSNANNTYSGATYVKAGTLLVNGTLATPSTVTNNDFSAVTVMTGGTLGGTGTINRPVLIQAGGTLSPGTSPGTLGIGGGGNLTLAGVANFQIAETAANPYDQVVSSGVGTRTINYGGTLNVTFLTPAVAAAAGTYTLFSSFTSFTGSFSTVTMPSAPSGYQFKDFDPGAGVDYFDEASGTIVLESLAVTKLSTIAIDSGPAVAIGTNLTGMGQGSIVRSITIVFDGVISSAPASAFALTDQTNASISDLTVNVAGTGTSTLTLTFTDTDGANNNTGPVNFASLSDRKYRLKVNGALLVSGGNAVDADGAGGGGAGSVGTQDFTRLFGDYNNNAFVDATDLYPFLVNSIDKGFGDPGYQRAFDYNNNAFVDATDIYPEIVTRIDTGL